MARLEVLGEYRGPGERLTAETLAAAFPGTWVILAGRSLPTPGRDDVDLIVIGETKVFVVEEKNWGPRIRFGDRVWVVNSQERQNPIDRVAHISRTLAGHLRQQLGSRSPEMRGRPVVPLVVLSREQLETSREELLYGAEVLRLGEAARRMTDLDGDGTPGILTVRDIIVRILEGFDERPEVPTSIGLYRVLEPMAPVGRVERFVARDTLDSLFFLRCFPLHGWGPDVDPLNLIHREREATNLLAASGRAWRALPDFEFEPRQWRVVPVEPTQAMSLRTSLLTQRPPRTDGHVPEGVARDIVGDAFTGLAQVHDAGVVHRGICPTRVFLGRQNRVIFTDFFLARAAGRDTIRLALEDLVDESAPYRAPECRELIGRATQASDVYALALSLSWWLVGDASLVPDADAVSTRLGAGASVTEILRRCLSPAPEDRPSASDVAGRLQVPAAPPSVSHATSIEIAVGAVLDDRYEVIGQLGEGASAVSWLVRDRNSEARRVLKAFKDDQTADRLRTEFQVADRFAHERCARVYDIQFMPRPGFLIVEYVDGNNLREFAAKGTADGEAYRQISLDVLDALGHLHSHDQLHRDVSPANMIVGSNARAKLIDFGLAASIASPAGLAGTPPYIAPEVWAGREHTVASDLYSFAASIAHAMLGRYPYAGDPSDGSDRRDELVPLSDDERRVWGHDTAIVEALYRGLDPDPASRPKSAAEFRALLEQAEPTVPVAGTERLNPTVDELRRLYRGSTIGNQGNRGLDTDFARQTYVGTRLDTTLLPEILERRLRLVVLTGNPGDGKTSFLVRLGEALQDAGGRPVSKDAAGWRIELDGHVFASVFDASEARGGRSSDELVSAALDADNTARHTALLAVNDGRLQQFFIENADLYPEYAQQVQRYFAGQPATDDTVAIVDLKRRTLAPLSEGPGLARQVVDTFVAPDRWRDCHDCISRDVCPILMNATLLRGPGGHAVGELVLTSHLRRRRRATFRDVRSALGWLITGDRGCADVHEARSADLNPTRAGRALAYDLAFDPECQDYLVQEWSNVDPAVVPAAAVERLARDGRSDGLDLQLADSWRVEPDLARAKRLLFFGVWTPEGAAREDVRAYRYLDEFVAALDGGDGMDAIHPRLLLGLSRLLGAPGYVGQDLAVSSGEAEGWSVIREVAGSEFSLSTPSPASPYVEARADHLLVQHPDGANLVVTLDVAEIILRAADGELFGDIASEALRLELDRLAEDLRRQPASRVQIVDPSGTPSVAELIGGTITLRGDR